MNFILHQLFDHACSANGFMTIARDQSHTPTACRAAQRALSRGACDAALARWWFGRIDVLVNNAGYGLLGGVEESSGSEVEQIYATNVFGLLAVTRSVLPRSSRSVAK